MQIQKLELQNFKKFIKEKIIFSDGINILLGKNEIGKSTISEALLLLLYTSPMSNATKLAKYKSWENDQGFKLSMDFENDGHKFSLVKDFASKEAYLKGDNGVDLKNPDLIQDYLTENLKIPGPGIYLNSCFVRQNEIMNLDNKDRDFKNALQNLVVEGEEKIDVNSILSKLTKEINELQKGVIKNSIRPGVIKTLQVEITELENKLRLDKLNWENAQKSNSQLEKFQNDNGILAQKVKEKEELLGKLNKLVGYKKSIKEFNEKLDAVIETERGLKTIEDGIKAINEKINQNFEKISQIGNLADVDDLVLQINSLNSQKDLLSGELNKKVDVVVPTGKLQGLDYLIIVGLVVAGVIISWAQNNWVFLIIGLILVLGFAGYKYLLRNKGPVTEVNQNFQYAGKLDQINKQQEKICEDFKVGSISELLKQINMYKVVLKELSDLNLQKKYILTQTTEDELKNNNKFLTRELNKIESAIDDQGLKNFDLSNEKINTIQIELEKMKKKLGQDEYEKMSLQAEIKLNTTSMEQINLLEEELTGKQEQLNFYLEKVKILTLVFESLKEAFQTTVHNSRGVIEKLVNNNISKLTLGHYEKVKVDEELGISVYSKEKNDWVEITETLSKGTIDQIYLLARIGFGKAILGKNSMPFIFDDPFVNFDEERLSKLKEILMELGKSNQILIMTHNKDFQNWGDEKKVNCILL